MSTATRSLSIALPETVLSEAELLASKESRTLSELVCEALRRYEWTRWLEETQAYGAGRAATAGVVTAEDVDRVVHEARSERRIAKDKQVGQARKAS